ncbi:methyltransferase domain-containing protein [Lysobacter sp. TAF61]|uniref:methyltransferase domain-containing protein n=1 Tax=Lysobacter sp. TAF61 TaxID=3233072 RepID=UPI003F9CE0E2
MSSGRRWLGLRQYLRKWTSRGSAGAINPLDGAGELRAFIDSIDLFNASQTNSAMLDEIRAYNHLVVGEFNKVRPLQGACLLDIGASPHGYAMEKCFELGVSRYVGVGLDIEADEDRKVGGTHGQLRYMNAQDLSFADCTFDAVVSMSTFEHIADVPQALREIHRVLKPGGKVLLSFEPLWTCAYGHHLHHFGEMSQLVPPWAHLVWDREQMMCYLEDKWPATAAIDLQEAIQWIYDSEAINRVGIQKMREHFEACPLSIEWVVPMMHGEVDPALLDLASGLTGLDSDELHTKGLSVLMYRDTH